MAFDLGYNRITALVPLGVCAYYMISYFLQFKGDLKNGQDYC